MSTINETGAASAILPDMKIRTVPIGASREGASYRRGSAASARRRRGKRSLPARLALALVGVVGLALTLFLGGFVVFAVSVSVLETPPRPDADAIVALTGGRDRVAEAIDLLAAGHARRLLISGVHPQTRAVDIQKMTEADRHVFACCVDLGRTALSTAGNAAEAADWARAHGFSSLIVVTSAYHMPRSLLELDRALPRVRKVPYAISRPDLNLETWFLHPATAKLLFGEYLKYIVARFAHGIPQAAPTVVAGVSGR